MFTFLWVSHKSQKGHCFPSYPTLKPLNSLIATCSYLSRFLMDLSQLLGIWFPTYPTFKPIELFFQHWFLTLRLQQRPTLFFSSYVSSHLISKHMKTSYIIFTFNRGRRFGFFYPLISQGKGSCYIYFQVMCYFILHFLICLVSYLCGGKNPICEQNP